MIAQLVVMNISFVYDIVLFLIDHLTIAESLQLQLDILAGLTCEFTNHNPHLARMMQ